MIKNQTVLAVIPARGGSKRVARKNIRDFRGLPLIAWSIAAAKGSRYIDMLVCSTEDTEIAAVAAACRCAVLARPAELATDDASNEDVLRHAMALHPHDWAVLLQPTSPLRTAGDIDGAIERATIGEACVSYRRDGTKNGAVYVASADWLAKHDFSHLGTMRYVMSDERSLDIDTEADFAA